jgi:uncharacterized peroxidase-related enzyme
MRTRALKPAAKPPISRFSTPDLADVPKDVRERIEAVQEKSGFVPNVFLALARRPDEFRAFFAYHDALMEKPGGLSKAEREMIVVATSGLNNCHYCVVAHGAILRIRAKNPLVADRVAINLSQGRPHAASKSDARLRAQSCCACARDRRGGLRGPQRPRFHRGRRLGHRRNRRLLRHVQPARERVRHPAER